jgi:hypothetical protein
MVGKKEDLKILQILNKGGCTSGLKSMTVTQVMEQLNSVYSYSKIHRTLTAFVIAGICDRGMKSGRAETFYITRRGVEEINRIVME